jgi:fatty-acid desaturase
MNKYFWLAFLPLHTFFILAIFNASSFWLIFFFWIILSGFGVGVALHRLLSHKSFETTEIRKKILSFIAVICAQGSPLFWVNIHRGYHHRHSDSEKDVHSPIHGKLWSYFLWTIKIKPETLNYKYCLDLWKDPFQKFLNDHYFKILWSVWIIAYLINPIIFYSLVISQIITMHLEFCVNLFCHLKNIPTSYRNFDTKDNSVNYWLFGVLCWGIGFHNNHHGKPSDYDFGHAPREIDLTKYLVKLVKV